MPRYEIIVHVTRELPCESAGDAAAIVRQQALEKTQPGDELLHLAVWREDPAPAASPLPPDLRQALAAFFATLEGAAGDAEAAFRERVAAILAAPAREGADAGLGADAPSAPGKPA
jgi:hypothetical protein